VALAWEEFVRRFHPLIAGVAIRVARRYGENSPQLTDELVQETFLKVCSNDAALLQSFRFEHSEAFHGFLKVLTANLVHDYFKSRKSKKRGGPLQTNVPIEADTPLPDPESSKDSVPKIERNVLVREIDDCLRSVASGETAARDRRIFWLYYRAGLPAATIATIPRIGLTTKGVESTLLRLTRDIRSRLVSERRICTGQHSPAKGIGQ